MIWISSSFRDSPKMIEKYFRGLGQKQGGGGGGLAGQEGVGEVGRKWPLLGSLTYFVSYIIMIYQYIRRIYQNNISFVLVFGSDVSYFPSRGGGGSKGLKKGGGGLKGTSTCGNIFQTFWDSP